MFIEFFEGPRGSGQPPTLYSDETVHSEMVAPKFRLGHSNNIGPSFALMPQKGNIPQFLNPTFEQSPENIYNVGLGPYQVPIMNVKPKHFLPQFMWHPR